jgi:hypothetical protein
MYLLSYEKLHNTLMNNPILYSKNSKPVIVNSKEKLEDFIRKNTSFLTDIDLSTYEDGFISFTTFTPLMNVPKTHKLYLLSLDILSDDTSN